MKPGTLEECPRRSNDSRKEMGLTRGQRDGDMAEGKETRRRTHGAVQFNTVGRDKSPRTGRYFAVFFVPLVLRKHNCTPCHV